MSSCFFLIYSISTHWLSCHLPALSRNVEVARKIFIFFVEKNDLGFFEVGPVLNVLNIRERGNPDAGSRSGCSSAVEHSPCDNEDAGLNPDDCWASFD